MRSLFLIVQREVRERMQTKSFRLFSAGLFLMVFGAIVAADQASALFGEDSFVLGVSTDAPAEFTAAIVRFAEVQEAEVELVSFNGADGAQALLDEKAIDAFVLEGTLTYAKNENTTLTAVVTSAYYSYELGQSLKDLNLTAEQQRALLNPTPLQVVMEDPDAEDQNERQLIGFFGALALYVTLAVYGNWILTGVIEEKATRVVEVLLGLVRPYELLAGKTLGILVVAVGQLLIAVAGAAAGLAVVGTSSIPDVALDVVAVSIPLFVGGLLLYSLIYAAAGATVSRQADAQAAATPIVMLLLVPYMFSAMFVPQNPDGIAATILSLVPITSPLVMPARVATGTPGALELIACYALLPPAILLVAVIGGRIYSASILSGSRPSLSSLVAAVLRPGNPS